MPKQTNIYIKIYIKISGTLEIKSSKTNGERTSQFQRLYLNDVALKTALPFFL